MENNATRMTLFSQNWKAEKYWGDELTAHHLNSRSVYRFKENDDISIIHTCVKDDNNEWVDRFTVCQYKVTEYHESGNVLSSESKVIEDFDNWLDAYYCGVVCVNNLNMELLAN